MKLNSTRKGASRYVVGNVPRFSQKYTVQKRATWEPSMREMAKGCYARFNGLAIPQRRTGYTLPDLALEMAGWHVAVDYGSGMFVGGEGLEVWEAPPIKLDFGKSMFTGRKDPEAEDDQSVATSDTTRIPKGLKLEVKDEAQASKLIKRAAKLFGASLVGVGRLDQRWVYSHSYHTFRKEHTPITIGEEYKYAIVMVYEMDYQAMQQAPDHIAAAAAATGYSRMAFTGALLAQYVRALGYKAIPMGNDTAISIPLAIDAGLGELSRMGLLITPEYGPRVRLGKVFTNMPLKPDIPVDFGVWEFCIKCEKCAHFCPAQAITFGPPTDKIHNVSNREGLLRWPLNAEKCLSHMCSDGSDCGVCIRVCPFNKPHGVIHDFVRWGIEHSSLLNPLFLRADNLLGNGRRGNIEDFWNGE